MIGKPKYNYQDKVIVTLEGKELIGSIYIIDKYGTFFDDSDVNYDILAESEKYVTDSNPKGEVLLKHINESLIKPLQN